jgi:hypothetical protein
METPFTYHQTLYVHKCVLLFNNNYTTQHVYNIIGWNLEKVQRQISTRVCLVIGCDIVLTIGKCLVSWSMTYCEVWRCFILGVCLVMDIFTYPGKKLWKQVTCFQQMIFQIIFLVLKFNSRKWVINKGVSWKWNQFSKKGIKCFGTFSMVHEWMSSIKKINLSPFHLCNLIFEFTKQLNALITWMDDLLRRRIISI